MRLLKYLFTILLLTTAGFAIAQQGGPRCATAVPGSGTLAWIEPDRPDVSDSVYVYINLAEDPNCGILVNDPGPLYSWTWSPTEPSNKIGTWNNSLETARMEQVGPNIWRFGMIPTQFYDTDPDAVYDNGICFLVKRKDGGSGGNCAAGGGDFKTTDIWVPVPKPPGLARKVYSFPDVVDLDTLYTRPDDVFTLLYNNNLEDKPSMQNLGDNVFVYFRVVGSNGTTYRYRALSAVGNQPVLKMKNLGDGQYSFSVIPKDLMAAADQLLPAGVTISRLRLQILKWPFANTDDAVDGEFYFTFKCD